jgi:hypothetical protein
MIKLEQEAGQGYEVRFRWEKVDDKYKQFEPWKTEKRRLVFVLKDIGEVVRDVKPEGVYWSGLFEDHPNYISVCFWITARMTLPQIPIHCDHSLLGRNERHTNSAKSVI